MLSILPLVLPLFWGGVPVRALALAGSALDSITRARANGRSHVEGWLFLGEIVMFSRKVRNSIDTQINLHCHKATYFSHFTPIYCATLTGSDRRGDHFLHLGVEKGPKRAEMTSEMAQTTC